MFYVSILDYVINPVFFVVCLFVCFLETKTTKANKKTEIFSMETRQEEILHPFIFCTSAHEFRGCVSKPCKLPILNVFWGITGTHNISDILGTRL